MWRRTATITIVVSLVVGVSTAASGHRTWTMTRVLERGSLIRITNSERVIGTAWTEAAYQPFLWHRGRFTYLPAGFEPRDVNEAGRVAGVVGAPSRASVWDRGTLLVLPLPEPSGFPDYYLSTAHAINNRGWVAGSARFEGGAERIDRAVVWIDGRPMVLPDAGCCRSEALDVNDTGQAVGYVTIAERRYAVVWDANGVTVLPQPVPPVYSAAVAINNRGQAVGWSTPPDGITRAVLWDQGTAVDLVPGAAYAYATAINERGQVVGYASDGTQSGAFLWEKGVLTVLGLDAIARDINNRGHAIGDAAGGGVLWQR